MFNITISDPSKKALKNLKNVLDFLVFPAKIRLIKITVGCFCQSTSSSLTA